MTPNAANDNHPVGCSIRFRVEPRLVPPSKAARRLHLTAVEFEAKRGALYGSGMPRPCPITGHFDLVAIDKWLDERAGIDSTAIGPDDFEARLAKL